MKPLNFRVLSYMDSKFGPHSVQRVYEVKGSNELIPGETFTIGDRVTNGTRMRGKITRFELSEDLQTLFVFTDWSGVGMNLESIIKTMDPLENCRLIDGIYFSYAHTHGIANRLSMCMSGDEVYFSMWDEPYNGVTDRNHCTNSPAMLRSYLETLDGPDLTAFVIENIETVYNPDVKLPSKHKVNDKVKVFLMPEGEESFPGFTAYIKGVHFYRGKVKYDLEIPFAGDMATRIYNVDSVLVLPYHESKKMDESPSYLENVFESLYNHIAHGDDEHRSWLKAEMSRFLTYYVESTKPTVTEGSVSERGDAIPLKEHPGEYMVPEHPDVPKEQWGRVIDNNKYKWISTPTTKKVAQ